MATINQNFEMYEGNSKKIYVTCTDDMATTPRPTDLTGATIKWGLKRSVHDVGVLILKETPDDIIIVGDPKDGVFFVKIYTGDTNGFQGAYYHEAEITDAEGNVATVMTGAITIHKAGI
jgi:hypothetical protein